MTEKYTLGLNNAMFLFVLYYIVHELDITLDKQIFHVFQRLLAATAHRTLQKSTFDNKTTGIIFTDAQA